MTAAVPEVAGLPVPGSVLLHDLRVSRRREAAEAVTQMVLAVQFAQAHTEPRTGDGSALPGTETVVQVAGAGAPLVAEFAVVEFAAAMGLSLRAGTSFLGAAVELAYRLPRTWQRSLDGSVPAWRARRIAEATMGLPVDGAAWVDRMAAPVAGTIGCAGLDRIVAEAIVRFDPEAAAEQAAESADERMVEITVQPAFDGATMTGRVDAVLDAADAIELEAAVAAVAEELARAGSCEPLPARRARAMGYLARGQQVLPLGPTDPGEWSATADQAGPGDDGPSAPTADGSAAAPARAAGRSREVVLHVRLNETALHGCGDGIATVTSPAGRPYGQVTVEQVQEWCATPDARIVVKPVLDLGEHLQCAGYQPSDRLRDQIVTIHQTCVFPYCTRPSATLDLDHIVPWSRGGPTSTTNLAPLCRRHHRAKTFDTWWYTRLSTGRYLWRSPHGHLWITDHHGTHDINPDTEGPPGSNTG